ncbi:MAG: hypothetical protein R3E96_17495, partial [Planctomycetota bacterium]
MMLAACLWTALATTTPGDLETRMPAQAAWLLHVNDPAGLLAGPHAERWALFLTERRWWTELGPDSQRFEAPVREMLRSASGLWVASGQSAESYREDWQSGLIQASPGTIAALQASLEGELTATIPVPGGEPILVLATGPLQHASQGDLFAWSLGDSGVPVAERLGDLLVGPGKDSPWSREDLAVRRRGDDLELLLNLEPIIAPHLEEARQATGGGEMIGDALARLRWAWIGATIDGRAAWNVHGAMPLPRTDAVQGLIACLDPLDREAWKLVPQDAQQALVLGMRWRPWLAWLRQVVQRWGESPSDDPLYEREFKQEVGIELEADLFAHLAPRLLFWQQPPRPAEEGRSSKEIWSLAFGVKNDEPFAA